jgi:signal transduction histidine kinase
MAELLAPAPVFTGNWLDQPADAAMAALSALADEAGQAGDAAAQVQAWLWLGQIQSAVGLADGAVAVERARAEAACLNDPVLMCRGLLAQAQHDADCGAHARALAACRSAAELARTQGDAVLVRQALFTSGTSLCHLGEHDMALEALEEARMLLRTNPHSLPAEDHEAALGRYAGAQAQAWLMRGGLLLEASGPGAAVDALRWARQLGEQACTALLGASPRFSHAALFGLVRVLLEAGEGDLARDWVDRVARGRPAEPPPGSLARALGVLSEAMIDLRAGGQDAEAVLARLAELEAVRHPRVVGGDLRLAYLRCRFEACEMSGRFVEALAHQRQWSHTKARVRAKLAQEHNRWTRETLSILRVEADDFVTHELRAPLGQAHAALRELVGEEPDATRRESLGRAAHSVRRALDIADQYLSVMRAEHLRPEDLAELDLSALAEDVCDQMAPPAGATPTLQRTIEPGIHVIGDRLLLMRAVANLLSNALKHAPAGSAVDLRLERQEGQAHMTVVDRGPGLPVDMRVRLFQRFATGAVRKGNGLGLALVARAARVHRARIIVDSETGRGTAVTLIMGSSDDTGR